MRKILLYLAAGLALICAGPNAYAQSAQGALGEVVANCGAKAYVVGDQKPLTQISGGAQCDEKAGASYSNITAATTTTVKTGAGTLHTLIINTPVVSGTITIYDNTAGSGTKIATITFPASLVSDGPITVPYEVAFTTGLTIVTTGTQNITAVYR